MSANTTYYILVPKLTLEWEKVSGLTKESVWEVHPTAVNVLHWSEYEREENGYEVKRNYDIGKKL